MTPRIKRLRDSTIKLWCWLIYPEWPYKCVICNKRKANEAHHLLRKVYWRRECFWDIRNGISICQPCHKYTKRVETWLEKNRPEQYAWLEQQRQLIRTGPKPMLGTEEARVEFLKEIQKSLLKQL